MSGSSHFPSREVAPAPRAKSGACDGRRSGGIYSEFGVACDHIEVDVSMQDRRVGANGDRPDEAIHELTDRVVFYIESRRFLIRDSPRPATTYEQKTGGADGVKGA